MKILIRLLSILFGIICGVLGLLCIFVSVLLMFARYDDLDDTFACILLALMVLYMCEILIAFGIVTCLVGMRFIFNRREWFRGFIDKLWKKAMRLALLLPFIGFIVAAVCQLIELLKL